MTETRDNGSTPSAVDEMAQFRTRGPANAGVKFPLQNAAGLLTEHWLLIRGVDSDEFRAADRIARRENVRVAAMDDVAARDKAFDEIRRKLIASLVAGWSFSKPCTPENIVEFLREAPQLEASIDTVATKRALFFANASASS